jgi:hypothetical protein
MASPQEIIGVCREQRKIRANASDSHRFVQAVAAAFRVALAGTADDIMAQIAGPDWTQHGMDSAAAADAAAAGELVVGGMTSRALGSVHGHVVVVVDGERSRNKYPRAYWGSLNPNIRDAGERGTTLNFSFPQGDRDHVVYASRAV